jgi:predicted DNA-binding transcriptional regulator AlpA
MSRTTVQSSSDEEYFSPREFSALTGLSLPTVRRYLANGQLPKLPLSGKRCRIVIPRTALAAVTAVRVERPTTPRGRDNEDRDLSGPRPRWTQRPQQRNS